MKMKMTRRRTRRTRPRSGTAPFWGASKLPRLMPVSLLSFTGGRHDGRHDAPIGRARARRKMGPRRCHIFKRERARRPPSQSRHSCTASSIKSWRPVLSLCAQRVSKRRRACVERRGVSDLSACHGWGHSAVALGP